jgi:hypothetical protein
MASLRPLIPTPIVSFFILIGSSSFVRQKVDILSSKVKGVFGLSRIGQCGNPISRTTSMYFPSTNLCLFCLRQLSIDSFLSITFDDDGCRISGSMSLVYSINLDRSAQVTVEFPPAPVTAVSLRQLLHRRHGGISLQPH